MRGPVSAFEHLGNVFPVFYSLSWKILNINRHRDDYIMNARVSVTQLQPSPAGVQSHLYPLTASLTLGIGFGAAHLPL